MAWSHPHRLLWAIGTMSAMMRSGLQGKVAPRAASRGSRMVPRAALEAKPKGWDRPWIQANSQPLLAPRTADMQGDPFGLLLRQRIVFMGGEVEDFSADAIISQLLLLDSQDPTKDIKMFINSPGGLWQ